MFVFSRGPRHGAFYSLSLLTFLLPLPLALAQPDTARRNFVPVAPPRAPAPAPPAVTLAQLQTLMGGPTLITFQGQDASIAEITKVFVAAANTSSKLPPNRVGGEAAKTLTVAWDKIPFWKAAQEVETLTGLRWGTIIRGELSLLPASYGFVSSLNGPSAAENPFVKVVASSIARSSNTTLNFGAKENTPPTSTDSTRLALAVYFDPKLQFETNRIQSVTVQNPEGPLVPVEQSTAYTEISGSSRLTTQLSVNLPKGLIPGTKIPRISGTLRTILVLSSQTWKIPDVSAMPKYTQTAGTDEYSIENVQVQADELKLTVTTVKPRLVAGAMAGTRSLFANLRLRDLQARELVSTGTYTKTNNAPDGGITLQTQLSFRLKNAQGEMLQAPFSLEWPLTTKTGTFDVPFELRDIPVP